MSERLHCVLCGRPAPALAHGCCSERCRELLAGGYTSPAVEAGALAPPETAWELRAIARTPLDEPLPDSVTHIATIGPAHSPRELLRVGGRSLDELQVRLGELAGLLPVGDLEVFTIHRYPPTGLGRRSPQRTGGPR